MTDSSKTQAITGFCIGSGSKALAVKGGMWPGGYRTQCPVCGKLQYVGRGPDQKLLINEDGSARVPEHRAPEVK